MMSWAQIPHNFWAEATLQANIIRNLSPTTGLEVTPYEALYGTRPDISRLRTFGSLAYVHLPKP